MPRDAQVVELIGRNLLGSELLRDGLEVAVPARDRGIDLIAYADLLSNVETFVARPIQMKAASRRSFSIDGKYERLADLIIAYIWHVHDPGTTVTYALTYSEAFDVAKECFDLDNSVAWENKKYHVNNNPGQKLCGLLEPYQMSEGKWWEKVTGTPYDPKRLWVGN
jgi:hypothetical protein